jgi:hypothetical protein
LESLLHAMKRGVSEASLDFWERLCKYIIELFVLNDNKKDQVDIVNPSVII